ncbi:MAG: hypothetical protein HQK61_08485, partial [Desulfamplus sp.]|nr:hypothetical protein [Desulfamplus sp.]
WNSPQGTLSTDSTFTTSKLSVGIHNVTLVVIDSNGDKGYADVTITVQPSNPTIKITSPLNGSSYSYNTPLVTTTGDYVLFEATAADAQDLDPDDIKITWRSSIDQEFGSGSSVSPVTLSAGSHLITATATDTDGDTATDSISITVKNQPPVASISLPSDNASFAFGDLVTFMGSATDPEQGKLTGDALVWTSSQGDLIGKGEVVASNSLKSGINIITLTVTDSSGAQDTASITITVGNAPPRAEITSPADGAAFAFRETITFKGTGVDSEDGNLPVSSLVWTSSSSSVALGEGTSLSVNNLPSGTHTITLTVTDSEGATAKDQIVVVVGNTVPIPVITAPANNSSHSFGRVVAFSGTASDAEDGPLTGKSLSWSSDKDGVLGSGESFSTTKLSINTHVITLTATDNAGLKGTTSITVTVGDSPPEVLITSPANKSSHGVGKPITFSGTGTDIEDGILTGENLSWVSDQDGFLGYGASLTKYDLSVNTHVITLTARDSGSRTSSKSITITVGNASPAALITLPADNSTHAFGQSIAFTGTGTDAEDGSLTGNSLKWESSIGGFLGYGANITTDKLAVGTHIITLTATDSKGLANSDTITVKITNTPPSAVKILAPSDGAAFNLNESIQFSGEASDSEDGELKGDSLVWTSNRVASPLGNGQKVSVNNLAIGQHLITLTATDSSGASAKTSIFVTIGAAILPEVSIIEPSDGSSFHINDYIEFKGEASDSIDGALAGENLVWTSDIETSPLGTGNILKINTLQIGEHMITLTAKNSNSVVGMDFIVITVANHSPVPVITSPADNAVFDQTEIIRFSGHATDVEDGYVTGTSLTWTSDIDGYLGNGVKFSKSLSYGDHTISLTARDNDGDIATAAILLKINPTEQNQPLALENMDFSLPLGQFGELTVTGGHPPYRYYKELPYIASIDIAGRKIKILPKSMGKTTFKIVDHYNNTKILSLTVTDSLQNLPLANAGNDQKVVAGTGVVLDGRSSLPGSNGIVSWGWIQVDSYKKVVLSDVLSSRTTFVAPSVEELRSGSGLPGSAQALPPEGDSGSVTLDFRLTVTDKNGNSSSDDVSIEISDNGINGYPAGVTSFYTIDRQNNLGMRISGDGQLVHINPQAPEFIRENVNRPENMIYGLVDLNVRVEHGQSVNMIVYFPQPLSEDYMAYKYSPARGWYSYSDYITFSSDRSKAYLMLTDGGPGDDDDLVDGIISDPLAFGTKSKSPVDPDTPSDGGGGGGGGCFISTLFE